MHAPLNVRLSKGLATATLVLATLVFAPRGLAARASARSTCRKKKPFARPSAIWLPRSFAFRRWGASTG